MRIGDDETNWVDVSCISCFFLVPFLNHKSPSRVWHDSGCTIFKLHIFLFAFWIYLDDVMMMSSSWNCITPKWLGDVLLADTWVHVVQQESHLTYPWILRFPLWKAHRR